MRVAVSLLLVGIGVVIVSSQEDELVPAPYLAPQYTAASDAPASVVMAGANEPGERLVVTGRVLDGAEPIAGASIFVFQTDAAGRYAPDKSGNDAELDPRLRGLLRTDRQGQYRYETIRPGSYNGNAAHVHYVVKAAGYKARLLDLWFEDDSILVARRAAGEPEIPAGIRNSPYYKASSDVVAIRPVARDARGVWHATRDIRMFKAIAQRRQKGDTRIQQSEMPRTGRRNHVVAVTVNLRNQSWLMPPSATSSVPTMYADSRDAR